MLDNNGKHLSNTRPKSNINTQTLKRVVTNSTNMHFWR